MQMSMFSQVELPAKVSAWQDFARALLTQGETSPSHILPSLNAIAPGGWSGKTSPAFYQRFPTRLPIHVHRTSTWTVTTDPETGKRAWSLTNTGLSKTMRFGVSWPARRNSAIMAGSSILTLNTSKHRVSHALSPSAGNVCSLSDILETGDVPPRYYLTPKACAGILRRAEKRGKDLPTMLHHALQAVAEA